MCSSDLSFRLALKPSLVEWKLECPECGNIIRRALKPSLVEWKRQQIEDARIPAHSLETFLSGMETHGRFVLVLEDCFP